MTITATSDLVSASWEPCSGFAPGDDGAPVCRLCGWLDHEHPLALATAPVPRARRRPPKSASQAA